MTKEELMHRAIELSKNSVKTGGGPFGAVIAKGWYYHRSGFQQCNHRPRPYGSCRSELYPTGYPQTEDLQIWKVGSCIPPAEPCPMCLGAIYWAHLDRINYANDRKDAAKIGFDDEFIYEEIDRKIEDRHKPMIALMRDKALGAFRMWEENAEKTEY